MVGLKDQKLHAVIVEYTFFGQSELIVLLLLRYSHGLYHMKTCTVENRIIFRMGTFLTWALIHKLS